MNLRQITLNGVFSYQEQVTLDVPPIGVVLVTGPNGAGKSSIIEAPCVAYWGKTLRGTPPWRGDKGVVQVSADTVSVGRVRKGNKTLLDWDTAHPADGHSVSFESQTKAQEALDRRIGTFDVWRRSRVFSSSDAAHFTLAADADRKRLLETLLGLERFDAAYEKVRADVRAQEAEVQRGVQAIEVERARAEEVANHVKALKAKLDSLPVVPVAKLEKFRLEIPRLEAMIAKVVTEQRALQEKRRALDRATGERSGEARAAAAQLAKLGGTGKCPTCGKAVDPKERAQLEDVVQREERARQAAMRETEAALAELQDEGNELVHEESALRKKFDVLRQEASGALRDKRARESAEAEWNAMSVSAEDKGASLETMDKNLAVARYRLALTQAASQVLGHRGVRAHILGKALVGVEAVANSWLKKLPLEDGRVIQLGLQSYTEKKTGGVVDAIAIKVQGAGGEYGYQAASAGERRRIDVALVFGFAAMSMSALESDALKRLGGGPGGLVGGTLFFDEVFDALDADGVVAVGQALARVAQDRAVIVVSHNPAVAAALAPVVHWHVEGGKVVTTAS